MNRRTLLTGVAAAGGAIAFRSARAQQPAPVAAANGPPVWLGLDQKALDDAYDQSVWATNPSSREPMFLKIVLRGPDLRTDFS